jgi:clan AA aspartic protease (TIGR02281 family)
LRCLKCKKHNHDKAKFCINCGVLFNSPNKNRLIYIIVIAGIFLTLFLITFIYNVFKQREEPKKRANILQAQQIPKAKGKLEEVKLLQQVIAPTDFTVLKLNEQNNTRETFFKKALLIKDRNPLESLALISKGICFPPNHSTNNTPAQLKIENIIEVMRDLISELSKKGYDNELLEILTPDVLVKTGNIQIFIDIVHIISENYGYGNAIHFVERVSQEANYSNALGKSEFDSLTLQLYQRWIIQQLRDNNINDAESIYEFAKNLFPANPEIHISGIEIMLKRGNWKKAEQLLNKMHYPKAFSDKIELLQAQVSELKGQAGKVAVRFLPGSKHIPVQAVINGKVKQDFLIDTGASFVTIPNSTIKALGIRINNNAPIINVSTAGGVKAAKEITLQSISLDRCSVKNIKVLVLDIPGQPKLGLLGLNFLHYFHMEINNKKGILLLKPRYTHDD